MRQKILEEVRLIEVPFGRYRVIGSGFFGDHKEGKNFVIFAGKDARKYLVHIPQGVPLLGRVDMRKNNRTNRVECVVRSNNVSRTEKVNTPKASVPALLRHYDKETNDFILWSKSITFMFVSKKWRLVKVDGKQF